MRRSITPLIMVACLGALYHSPALAYIGPGAGITLLGALWGVVVAIALALGAVFMWPVRIIFRRLRRGARGADTKGESAAEMNEDAVSEVREEDQARHSRAETAATAE